MIDYLLSVVSSVGVPIDLLLSIPGVVKYVVIAYFLMASSWLFYTSIMHLRIVRDREGLTVPQKVMGYPLLVIGLVIDVLLNWLVVSILLLEVPKEFLTTARFKRYRYNQTWRGKQVRWWCRHFLEPFDVGHCG